MRPRALNNTDARSIITRLRRERFRLLEGMLGDGSEPVTILDIGGTPEYWQTMVAGSSWGDRLRITLLNIESRSIPPFFCVAGDGRSMPQFADKQFDIVFSNSTIEHVGTFEDQVSMANEVRRVGRSYYVQTPNRRFPIEPHFMFPFFQFLPLPMRLWLVRHFSLGWYPAIRDRERARSEVTSIRLLTKAELERLFPDATIFEERFFGLVKSLVAYTEGNGTGSSELVSGARA